MEVICLQDDAFFSPIDRVIKHINEKIGSNDEDWVSGVQNAGGNHQAQTVAGILKEGQKSYLEQFLGMVLSQRGFHTIQHMTWRVH